MGLFDGSENDFQYSDFNTNMDNGQSGGLEGLGAGLDMFGDNPEDFGLGGSANLLPELPAELELYKNSAEQVAASFMNMILLFSLNMNIEQELFCCANADINFAKALYSEQYNRKQIVEATLSKHVSGEQPRSTNFNPRLQDRKQIRPRLLLSHPRDAAQSYE